MSIYINIIRNATAFNEPIPLRFPGNKGHDRFIGMDQDRVLAGEGFLAREVIWGDIVAIEIGREVEPSEVIAREGLLSRQPAADGPLLVYDILDAVISPMCCCPASTMQMQDVTMDPELPAHPAYSRQAWTCEWI